MLSNVKKSDNNKGFTIIEVMIVLAIAGLIMLIVFLAVPALQRNQRNSTRKSDAARVAAAASNFVSNNNGKLPGLTAVAAGQTNATSILNDAGDLGQYSLTTNTTATAAKDKLTIIGGGTASALTTDDTLQIVEGGKCSSGGAVVAGNTKSMALQYTLESKTSGTPTASCVDV